VAGLRLRDTVTGEESTLDVTAMFVAIGHDPRSDLVQGRPGPPTRTATCSPRAPSTYHRAARRVSFAAATWWNHTYRQAVTAAGSGCAAAIDAERWLAEQPVDPRIGRRRLRIRLEQVAAAIH